MNRTLLVLAAAAAVMLGACGKKKPSPDFEQASRAFSRLYGERLDDAYLDPRIEEIEAQLQRVPSDSLDAESAQQLLARIRDGRQRMEAVAERQRKAVEEATQTPPFVGTQTGPGLEERPAEGTPDAGVPHPVRGMPITELSSRFADCFSKDAPLEIVGRGQRDTYVLRDTAECRAAHPGFEAQLLVIEDGKVLALAPKAGVQTRTEPAPADAGTAPSRVPATNDAADAGR